MSAHVLHPFGDGDKCVCSVRISGKADRVAAANLDKATCDTCILRVLRTWQQNVTDWTSTEEETVKGGRVYRRWPWDDPAFVAPPELAGKRRFDAPVGE